MNFFLVHNNMLLQQGKDGEIATVADVLAAKPQYPLVRDTFYCTNVECSYTYNQAKPLSLLFLLVTDFERPQIASGFLYMGCWFHEFSFL